MVSCKFLQKLTTRHYKPTSEGQLCKSQLTDVTNTSNKFNFVASHTRENYNLYCCVSVKSILHVFCGKMTGRKLQIYCLFVGISYSTMCCGLQRLSPEYGREFSFSNPYLVLKPGFKKADAVRSAFPHNTQDVV